MKPKSTQGQISILIAVMLSTFFFFFAFVINVGMLVNAKINLQNAADLAAYAGAAVQARQLNQISYLNYEMRRQFKKFLFRLYVLGPMSYDSFPRGGGGDRAMSYKPNASEGTDYGAPTTCIIFNSADNYCHLSKLSKITIPPGNPLDAISMTLVGQLEQIEKIRLMNCKAIGMTNLMLNMYWLYNADPELKNLESLAVQQKNTTAIIQGLASGLGIVPKEMLLKFRIRTMETYVNTPAQLGVKKENVDGQLSGPDPAPFERTAQAFYSAYYTLGNHAFDGGEIQMDELMPSSSLNLIPIQQSFDTYAIDFDTGTGVGAANATNGANCVAFQVPIAVKPLTLGFYKDPAVLTYYALRLKAKAHVLFSPFGDNLEIKAYAAARPFGSRIGPKKPEFAGAGTGSHINPTAKNHVGFIPNLPVKSSDSAGRGAGWDKEEIVATMYEQLTAGGGTGVSVITGDSIRRAYQVAMAPNPYEANNYNIINDAGNDPLVKNFDRNMLTAIWAPIFTAEKSASMTDALKSEIDEFFDSGATGNFGAGDNQSQNLQILRQSVSQALATYIGSLSSNEGEDGESTHIVKIRNPFVKPGTGGSWDPIGGNSEIFLTNDFRLYRTSWNSVNRSDFQQAGRVGYSVKFISFDSLTDHKSTSDGSNNWTNTLQMDPESEQDIPFLKH